MHFSLSVGCRDLKFGRITYWGNENTHTHTNRNTWFKLPLPPDLLLPICVCVWWWTYPKILDGSSWNFVGWYIIVLGRFSNRSSYLYHRLAPELGGLLCISPKVLVAETWNLVRLHIEAMSTLTHTPTETHGSSYLYHRICSYQFVYVSDGELILKYWTDRHEIL